jgi:protein phosphatase
MGSRAVVVVCRDEDARERFGVDGEIGIVYTRTGRRFFNDARWRRLLDRVRAALTRRALGRARHDWVCLDCELMPWSAKAQELLRTQYAAVGRRAGGAAALALLRRAAAASGGDERIQGSSRAGGRAGRGASPSTSPPTGATAGRSRRSTT